MIIPLTPAKKKPRYRAVVVTRWSHDWYELLRQGWREHRVMVYAGRDPYDISTMIRRVA